MLKKKSWKQMNVYDNPFHITDLLLYPAKNIRKFFPVFSGGIEIGKWHEMG